MILVVHELDATFVKQKITIGAAPLLVTAMRPYLYKSLAPGGYVYLQVQDENGRPIKDSEHINVSSLSGSDYFHGYYKFLITVALQPNTDYFVALKSGGAYTPTDTDFVGWCNTYLFKNTGTEASYDADGYNAPLGLQIWEYKAISKGDQ